MLRTVANKAFTMLLFLLALSMLVFLLARLAPGDPLRAYYGEAAERMNDTERAAAMSRLSLDRPVAAQYGAWLRAAITGDFGLSHQYKRPVSGLIGEMAGGTLLLGGISYGLTFALAVFLGVLSAAREGGILDRLICRVGTATSAIPSFFVALLAILVFGVNLRLLPTGGSYSGDGGFLDRGAHLILPVGVMVISHLWYYASLVRNRMLEEIQRDYVLLLRVKRLSESRILFVHCLRNMLPTLIALMAASVPHILAGTYVVETVFGYPGLGTLLFESARDKDYNLLSALTLLTGCLVLLSGMGGTWLSELLDHRMRHENTASGEEDGGGSIPE